MKVSDIRAGDLVRDVGKITVVEWVKGDKFVLTNILGNKYNFAPYSEVVAFVPEQSSTETP